MTQELILVIPAHNEEAGIYETLLSIQQQTVQPNRTIVLCDNCSDATAQIAESMGVEVIHTVNNKGKKGGALNQAWDLLGMESGYFATMDADTILAPDFFEKALERFARAKGEGIPCGGVSATFGIKSLHTTLSLAQELEYGRFCRVVGRKKGRPHCLAGAAVVYNAAALKEVCDERGSLYLPVLVEDYELSLALRHRGYKIYAPKHCRAITEVMPTLRTLWQQRTRWYLGTMQELRKYGFSRITWRDFGGQGFTCLTIAFRWLFVFTLVTSYAVNGALELPWWAAAPLIIFATSRAVESSRLGWKRALIAACMFEELYLLLLESIFLVSGLRILFGREEQEWGHVPAQFEAQTNEEHPALMEVA
jgi:cellulose synthase/poly-beta-1,6-N-acetylglucosamine synthase-like glycosyltransferase